MFGVEEGSFPSSTSSPSLSYAYGQESSPETNILAPVGVRLCHCYLNTLCTSHLELLLLLTA
jgi:hypothetical protein